MPDVFKNDLYLSRKTARDGEVVTILDAGKWIPNKFKEGEELFQVRVMHNNAAKTWTLNNKSRKNLGQSFGADSDGWIGKSVRLAIEQGQSGDMLIGYGLDDKEAEFLRQQ
jgi:hypothetical protein